MQTDPREEIHWHNNKNTQRIDNRGKTLAAPHNITCSSTLTTIGTAAAAEHAVAVHAELQQGPQQLLRRGVRSVSAKRRGYVY